MYKFCIKLFIKAIGTWYAFIWI